jgi:hypothetical protein
MLLVLQTSTNDRKISNPFNNGDHFSESPCLLFFWVEIKERLEDHWEAHRPTQEQFLRMPAILAEN